MTNTNIQPFDFKGTPVRALAVTVMCFLLLVGSDASVTPLRNTILVIIYVASAAIATHEALEVRHE